MRTSLTPVTGRSPSARSTAQVLEPAQRLTDSLLVLDEREADVAFAVLAEADTRRHGHLRLLDEQLGELERAQTAEGFGDRRPHEHCALRLRDAPAELVEPIHQHVAALAVNVDDLGNALLVRLQRHDAGDLDRLERAAVEVGLDARQRAEHPRLTAQKAQPPAGHAVRL